MITSAAHRNKSNLILKSIFSYKLFMSWKRYVGVNEGNCVFVNMFLPVWAWRKWSQNPLSPATVGILLRWKLLGNKYLAAKIVMWGNVFVPSSDLGRILVLLLPNNGRRLVFLFMSDWKRNLFIVYDRTCIHDGFVQPASADLCLKLACRHSIMAFFTKGEMVISSVFLVIMWFHLFPPNTV